MRHRVGSWSWGITFLLLAMGPAWAQGALEGKGFRLAVPAGFQRTSDEAREQGWAEALDLAGHLPVRGTSRVHAFHAGSARNPDAVLLVARIELADPGVVRSSRDLQRYMLETLRVSGSDFERLLAEDAVELSPHEQDGFQALQLSHAGARGPRGDVEEPAARALAVVCDEALLVLLLMVQDERAVSIEATWTGLLGTLEVEVPGALARQALLYGGCALAGLLLLVLLVRLRARRRHERSPLRSRPAPVPVRPASDESAPAQPPAPGGRTPALRSESLEPAVEEAAPRPSVAPASVPAPPMSDVADDEPIGLPPPMHKPTPPARKGLKRTLPSNGRFSD